jgi:hypothetical protein
VHTFQGKEAATVLFVLGLDRQRPGALEFASRRVNLLNVAVTRAKHRLYVVGDKSLWRDAGHFARLAAAFDGDATETVDEFRERDQGLFKTPFVLARGRRATNWNKGTRSAVVADSGQKCRAVTPLFCLMSPFGGS